MVQIVEQVNSIVSELIKQSILDSQIDEKNYNQRIQSMEEEFLFVPEKGNVAFSSAIDCWSFTLPSFVPKLAE